MKTQFFANGPHAVGTISKDFNLATACQSQVKVIFNNELSSVSMDKGYWFEKPFRFSALSSSPSTNYTVEVNDSNGDISVYSRNFTGDINAVIPPEVFDAENFQSYYLTVKDSSGNVKFEEVIARDYDKWVKWEKSQKQ